MIITPTIQDGPTEQEAWLILAIDALDTISTLLPNLSKEAKTEINNYLALTDRGYDSWEDLAHRADNIADHINPCD